MGKKKPSPFVFVITIRQKSVCVCNRERSLRHIVLSNDVSLSVETWCFKLYLQSYIHSQEKYSKAK